MTPLPYNGPSLDRAGTRRADEAWVDAVRRHPDARVLAFWRDGCLVAGGRPVVFAGEPSVFLGVAADGYTPAGFVEIGESLEDAVRRERRDSIEAYLVETWLTG